MGKTTGFKEYQRETPKKRPVDERVQDDREIYVPFPEDKLIAQAARCMDCGVPTCMSGCPLGNLIPEWNDLVYRKNWREAIKRLHATNNFPEFTGRLCPAPCEEACVLGINAEPVTIELIEKHIVEHAFENGWIKPEPPETRTGKRVAVVGSGPAGMACAQQLNRAGHAVTVFERQDRPGGLIRYGIPDFKMDKKVIDRRLAILEAEGVAFRTNVTVGKDITGDDLRAYDAAVVCAGALRPRDLPIPGRELSGIHFAMDFLKQHNLSVAGQPREEGVPVISARDRHVIVIGGGDTGSDCVGVGNRQGAKSVVNFQYSPMPPTGRPKDQPWPYWPMRLRTSSSHEEGADRQWDILTKAFIGEGGRVKYVLTVNLASETLPDGTRKTTDVPGSEKKWPADLVLLAIGYQGTEPNPLYSDLNLKIDDRGNILTDGRYMTPVPGIFAAGDARSGQSIIVRAISEGREAARAVDIFLMGKSALPEKGCCNLSA